jgi:hypothetical protein
MGHKLLAKGKLSWFVGTYNIILIVWFAELECIEGWGSLIPRNLGLESLGEISADRIGPGGFLTAFRNSHAEITRMGGTSSD